MQALTLHSSFSTFAAAATKRLFIHPGLLGQGKNWQSIAKQLSHQFNLDVVCLDPRNHGESPRSTEHSYPLMAADLLSTISTINADRGNIPTLFLGHSMGGKVVGQLLSDLERGASANLTTEPPRVIAAVIVDISMKQYDPSHNEVFQAIGSVPVKSIKMSSEAVPYLENAGLPLSMIQFLRTNLRPAKRGSGMEWAMNYAALTKNYSGILAAPDMGNKPVSVPTHVISGSRSDYVTEDDQDLFRRQFSDVTFSEVEGAGHWVHADKPNLFMGALTQFISPFL
ncbi:MAG: alpha/beta fold hydrolase [bacterium]|nr:alpha/beta fold hydrolase [bacterium]